MDKATKDNVTRFVFTVAATVLFVYMMMKFTGGEM